MNMLESLVNYARANGLSDDPSQRSVRLSAAIHLSKDGQFQTLVEYSGEEPKEGDEEAEEAKDKRKSKKKRQRKGQTRIAPSSPKADRRTSGVEPYFLVDNTQYVLGLAEPKKLAKNPEKTREDASKKQQAFYDFIAQASKATKHPALPAILNFHQNKTDWEKARALGERLLKPGANLCFVVDDKEITDDPDLLRYNKSLIESEGSGMCMVCGDAGELVAKQPSVKGFPAGNEGGVPLFSNNQSAFRSVGHNKDGMENAPVCVSCANGYARALSLLLKGDDKGTKPQAIVLGRHPTGKPLSHNKVLVYWSNVQGVGQIVSDLFNNKIPETTIGELYKLIETGEKYNGRTIEEYDLEEFNVALFGCQKGRISVRFHTLTTVGEIYRHIINFIQRTSIRNPYGDGEMYRPAIWEMALSGYPIDVHAQMATCEELIHSALFEEPFSDHLLEATIQRVLAEPESRLLRRRVVTLHYCVWNHLTVREPYRITHQLPAPTGGKVENMSLERTCDDMPYLLGRLVAVAEEAQRRSVGVKAKMITDVYLDSLVKTPGADIGDFLNDAVFYIRQSPTFVREEADQVFNLMSTRKLCENGQRAHDTFQQARCILGYQAQRFSFIQAAREHKKETPNVSS